MNIVVKVPSKPPARKKNSELRPREYLTPSEVQKLMAGAEIASKLYGRRNSALILFSYRHALRVSEATGLEWNNIFLQSQTIHVRRLKNSDDSTHYLEADEIEELSWLRDAFPNSKYVFCTRSQRQLSPRTVQEIVAKAGVFAKLPFSVHPHMLRHAKGYELTNKKKAHMRAIQKYFGHKNIQHTALYTDLSPEPFKGFGLEDLS